MEAPAQLEGEPLEEVDQNIEDDSFVQEQIQQEEQEEIVEGPKRRRCPKITGKIEGVEDDLQQLQQTSKDIYDDNFIVDKLPDDRNELATMLSIVNSKIKDYKSLYLRQQEKIQNSKSYVGDNAIPICADVTKFDFERLISKQREIAHRQFDVIMMDPPWRLSSSQPSRGVAIQYSSLGDEAIEQIPIPMLQKEGFLFIWVINAKFSWTVKLMQKKWGYKVVDSINWVKKTVNNKIAKGHGFYLQHAKQTCIVGFKRLQNPQSASQPIPFVNNIKSDVIFSERRGQSQKPTEIYEYIEKLVPGGYYLQIFGRRNNLRDNWVTIGNQI